MPAGDDPLAARYLERVGSVPRWVRFKKEWHVDPDWLKYRNVNRLVFNKLGYQPSKRSVDVENVRLRDYDRLHKPLHERDRKLLKQALEYAKAHFMSCGRKGVISLDEAIKRVVESECADSSPGYPLNQRFKTKAEALADTQVLAELRDWVSRLGTKDVTGVLFSLSLKDEIMKTTKVEEQRTRLFMAAPLFHHVAMVMYCGNMHDAFIQLKATWCSAGHDFHYGGWDGLMRKLCYDLFFAADAEMYDMTIGRELFQAVYELTAEMVPEGGEALFDLFQMALDSACVTSRGTVYYKFGGNPSGWYLTLFLNTVVMYLSIAMMWLDTHADTSRREFEDKVRGWICGDDSIVNVHPDEAKVFTEAVWRDVWRRLGLIVKKIESSTQITQMEYCGAYTLEKCGRYCRKPRVQKFLDALNFTQDRDPLYRLQRAFSIYHELWTVPEALVVRGYIDFLVLKYPRLASVARRYEKSESELAFLHLGLEGISPQGLLDGCVTDSRPKDSSERSNKKLDSITLKRKCEFMPKTDAAKLSRKAKRAEKAAALVAASKVVAAKTKTKAKKKKSSGFWGALAGAAKMAAELAPTVAPLLLANHAPSAARAQLLGSSSTPQSSVGLAAPASCATCTGLYQSTALRGKDGRVIGMKMCGLDYVGTISCDEEVAGSVLSNISLNPLDAAWTGTQLQRFATLFERYRPHRLAGMIEPSCPATTQGQVLGFIDPDPDDEFDEVGRTALQVGASHEGADISQVWGMNCAAYAFDPKTQDFYADADGSDERLISPGNWRILANTDMPADTVIGSLYVSWEYTFSIPQIEEFSPGGLWGWRITDTDITGQLPFDVDAWDPEPGTLPMTIVTSSPVATQTLTGLPSGEYVMIVLYDGTGATSLPAWTVVGDSAGNYVKAPGQANYLVADEFASTVFARATFHFVVNNAVDDPDQGGLTFSWTATGTADADNLQLMIFQVKSSSLTTHKRTLQQIEKSMQAEMEDLRASVETMRALLSSSATAGGTTNLGLLSSALSTDRNREHGHKPAPRRKCGSAAAAAANAK